MNFILPFISGFLYRLGGSDQQTWSKLKMKWYRWLMGIPLGFLFTIGWASWATVAIVTILSGITFYIATSAFKYGENSWLNFLGEKGKFTVCGIAFGLASIPMFGWVAGIIQGIVAGCAFLCIKILDDKGIIHNPYVELCRGFFGIIISFFK